MVAPDRYTTDKLTDPYSNVRDAFRGLVEAVRDHDGRGHLVKILANTLGATRWAPELMA
jgi:hypothetical protein